MSVSATSSVADAFAAGDYMGTALRADPGDWRYHASRGLIVDPQKGIAALGRFDEPDARFYSAVLSWMAGDEDAACRAFERIATPRAQRLLEAIRRPRIRVLSMLPPVRHGAFVLREGIRHDPKFEVCNVGVYPDDVPERPYGSIADYQPAPGWADLFIAQMIEWHQLPVDIGALRCPTIGFTNDFDLHIQGLRQWFDAFDVRIVIDHTYEWPTLRGIAGDPTLSFPLVFGVSGKMPPLDDRVRDIDVLFSGTLVSSYNPEKEKLVRELLQIPGIRMVLVDGHVADAAYQQLLARAKITPSFCRHRGGIQTRVIETLAMGSISVVQPDSIMQLWADRDTGLWEYDESIGPAPQIRDILAAYDRCAPGCVARVPAIRAAFEARATASKLFRFCVFAATHDAAARPRDRRVTQKRVMFAHGPSASHGYAVELARQNTIRMDEPTARDGLDRAREWLMVYARALYDNRRADATADLLAKAIEGYRAVIREVPRNLVARFNLLRVLVHFGDADDLVEAGAVLGGIITAAPTEWEVDASDDVLPYDFMPEWFDYRAYLDIVVAAHARGAEPCRARMRDLLLAAALHYRAVRDGSIADARAAVALNPQFTPFRLTFGELAARSDDPVDRQAALDTLGDLALGSNAALRARWQIEALTASGERIPHGSITAADQIRRSIRGSMLQTEHYHLKLVSPYFVADRLGRGWTRGDVIARQRAASRDGRATRLALIVYGRHAAGAREVLTVLASQTVSRSLFEVVYVDAYTMPPPDVAALADVVIALNQRELLDTAATAWRTALAHTSAPVLAMIQAPADTTSTFVAQLVSAFYPSAGDEPTMPRSLAIASGSPTGDDSAPQWMACLLRDLARAGGWDEGEAFRGDGTAVPVLLDRLARIGVPRFVAGNDGLRIDRRRWWTCDPWLERSGRIAAARLIWPALFDSRADLARRYQAATLVHVGAHGNVLSLGGTYLVAPFAAGAIDLATAAQLDDPPLRVYASLEQARQQVD